MSDTPRTTTLPDKLKRWLEQPGSRLSEHQLMFIEDMRDAAKNGVGYGFMQQVIEWEWQSRSNHSWGPEWHGQQLSTERARADKAEEINDGLIQACDCQVVKAKAYESDAKRYWQAKRLSMAGKLPQEWLEGWLNDVMLDAAIDKAMKND